MVLSSEMDTISFSLSPARRCCHSHPLRHTSISAGGGVISPVVDDGRGGGGGGDDDNVNPSPLVKRIHPAAVVFLLIFLL
jgi:hypothetical protein